jgi:hypothetical protein
MTFIHDMVRKRGYPPRSWLQMLFCLIGSDSWSGLPTTPQGVTICVALPLLCSLLHVNLLSGRFQSQVVIEECGQLYSPGCESA